MGLFTKIKSARTSKSKQHSKSKQQASESSSNSTGGTTKKLFSMRRTKCRTPADSTGSDCTNDMKNSNEITTQSLAFRVVSIPKEYTESNERFNWLTNELDSFEYRASPDAANAVRRVSESSSLPSCAREQAAVSPESDCFGPFCLFPCWGSRPMEKDVVTHTSPGSTATSYDGSASTAEPVDNKEGEVLEAKPVDDVSDVTSAPSEDYSDSDGDDESYSRESPNKEEASSCSSSES